jgi:hypothetical protein
MLTLLGGIIGFAFFPISSEAQTKNATVLTKHALTGHQNTLNLLYFASYVRGKVRKYSDINMDALEAIKDSPFDSYSLVLDKPDYKMLFHNINLAKTTNKIIWPRIIFPNYMIEKPDNILKIWDERSVEKAFMYVKTALKIAKETGVKGIFIDPEPYNNSKNYLLSYVAENNNKGINETIERLKELGARFADCVHEEYKNRPAVLWFAFADLFKRLNDGYGRSGNYIIEGILDRTIQKNYNITVVDGGETTIGYINLSLDELRKKIEKQRINQAQIVEKYGSRFELGSTTILFYDLQNTGFWARIVDKMSEDRKQVKTIEDYIPLLKEMFTHYRYVWIYWSGFPMYDEFDPESAKLYRPIIAAALAEMKNNRR